MQTRLTVPESENGSTTRTFFSGDSSVLPKLQSAVAPVGDLPTRQPVRHRTSPGPFLQRARASSTEQTIQRFPLEQGVDREVLPEHADIAPVTVQQHTVSTGTSSTSAPVTPPSVARCAVSPKRIFSRGACGGGTDFTHNDFPSLSGVSKAKRAAVWEADNLTFDWQLRNRMRLELSALAGSEGLRMVDHFSAGAGSKLTHRASSTLGTLALGSDTFNDLHHAVIHEIEDQLAAMHRTGAIECDHLNLSGFPLPAVSFGFSDGFALKGIIGGTQGLKIYITRFRVDPATRRYLLSLKYVICDDFGVDTADLYSPALIAFWVLQHRRSGNLPFINELNLPKNEIGTY